MPVSPTIPTSFVPKQPLDAPRRKMDAGDNILLIVSLIILAASLIMAGGVFGYQKYLESAIEVKAAALEDARSTIDQSEVEELIRLKDRFVLGKSLLQNHIASSRFFALLETITLENVKYDELELLVSDDRSTSVTLTGYARNFNTLAAQSNEIAAERNFKRAIFSDISLNTNGTVEFTLTAYVNADLMRMAVPEVVEAEVVPEEPVIEEPVGTTTEPTATSTAPAATTTQSL